MSAVSAVQGDCKRVYPRMHNKVAAPATVWLLCCLTLSIYVKTMV